MTPDLRRIKLEMRDLDEVPRDRPAMERYIAGYQESLEIMKEEFNEVVDYARDQQDDANDDLKKEKRKQEELEAELKRVLSYLLAEREKREKVEAEVVELRDKNEQIAADYKQLHDTYEQLDEKYEQLSDDNEQLHRNVQQLTDNNKHLADEVEQLRLRINNTLAVDATKTYSQDTQEHQQKKRKVGEGYKDDKDEQSAAIGEPGICGFWKLNGRCRYGAAGKTCRDGYHPYELAFKNRNQGGSVGLTTEK
jgi:chromosome segregation ATPase